VFYNRDLTRDQLRQEEPEFWNELVLSGRTEKVLDLIEIGVESGKLLGSVGGVADEPAGETLDRTLQAFVGAYVQFAIAQFPVVPGPHDMKTELVVAAKLISPRLLASLAREFANHGVPSPMIEAVQEIQQRKELILPNG
jgi:hypothetical protein